MQLDTTIAAIATAPGMGAIAVIRMSGSNAIAIADKIFKSKNPKKRLENQKPYTIHFGEIADGDKVYDEVLISLFRAPRSYTGEDMVEISCHGSQFIQQQILELLVRQGAQMAQPGEFTLRAFLNGKMDLSQAEAVADLIASSSEAGRRIAMMQMRGGFSDLLRQLRDKLLTLTSLIELELDFSDEDVEFANREQLNQLVNQMHSHVSKLAESFSLGNVLKQGIPVAIAGKPNVGKSTLLNTLLKEERAIVSDIAGTTRDTIEDTINIGGITFRFVDTAGLRETEDYVESLGIERAKTKISQADIVMLLLDPTELVRRLEEQVSNIKATLAPQQRLLVLINKADMLSNEAITTLEQQLTKAHPSLEILPISARIHINIDKLTHLLLEYGKQRITESDDVVITNLRHYQALSESVKALEEVKAGLALNLPNDLLAFHLRDVLRHIGEITGEFTNDEVLGNIFKNFCIGK